MIAYFQYAIVACEGIAAFTGLYLWLKYHDNFSGFVYYIIFIFLMELAGLILIKTGQYELNALIVGNIALPAGFVFLYWFLARLQNNTTVLRVALLFDILYLIAFFYEKSGRSIFEFVNISFMLGNLFLILLVLYNLYVFIKTNEILDFKRNEKFYIYIGILLFYFCTFPFYAFKNTLWVSYKNAALIYWCIAMILNCLMYCMFTYSFVCRKKKYI